MTQITVGQIYRSCEDGGPRIRITAYTPGMSRAHIVDADDGKRFRQILVSDLHPTATTKTGQARRRGYALEGDPS